MPYLEIKLGPDSLLLPFVGRIDYVFGRLKGVDVQLRDMKVSRLHSQLFIDSRGNAWVRDLGSSIGTIVGPRRLKKGGIAPLADGARLKLGDARITFYDGEPPTNAVQPPARSGPRGTIRTTDRDRHVEGEATVLAAEKVDDDDPLGPAEPPPEVDPAEFSAEGAPVKQASKKTPEVGIVEAPWDKKSGTPGVRDEMVSLKGGRKPTKRLEPPMQTAGYDETGQVESPEVIEDTGESRLLPEDTADLQPDQANESEFDDAGSAFRKPAEFTGLMPQEAEEEDPRPDLPTVRLERSQIEAKPTDEDRPAKNKIPTTRLDKASIEERRLQEEEEDIPPTIGKPVRADDVEGQKFGWESGDEPPAAKSGMPIHQDGNYEEVDLGDADDDDPEVEEVRFGTAARIGNADESIDTEDNEPEPTSEAEMENHEDIPAEDDEQDETHPPPARQGATPDRAFKPRKTRKLMKHRPGTGKVTDKRPDRDEESALVTDQPVTQGDDTVFVPKPDDKPTGKPLRHAENRNSPARDFARGPGGDTMSLPADVMKELRDELKEREGKPETSDETPPVKDAEDEVEGNDFMAETEDLPASRKRPNDDTIVE